MHRWLLLWLTACSGAREPTIWDPLRASQPFRPQWCASHPTPAAPATTAAPADWLDVRDNLVCTAPAHTDRSGVTKRDAADTFRHVSISSKATSHLRSPACLDIQFTIVGSTIMGYG